MAVSQAAKAMVRDGIDVVDLSLGEPDFDTPQNVIEAGIRAMQSGHTRYTAPAGTPELKDAVVAKLKRDNNLDYDASQITVGAGAKQVIFNALMATLEPGDEVILLAPYFVSYPDMVRLNGATPVVVPSSIENGFRPRREDLQAALTPKTRWIILNSPSNPSGAVFSEEDLRMIGDVIKPYERVLVLSDEIYESIVFSGAQFVPFITACPDLYDRTLTVNGLSKSHAMTGWRFGYGAGPADLIAAMTKLQSQSTTNVSSITQVAAIEALLGDQTFVDNSRKVYEERRNLLVQGLADVPLLKAFTPEGAFYVFAECSEMIGKVTPDGAVIANDADAATYLLKVGRVAGVPGAAYGMEPYVRFSLATSEAQLEEAISRLKEATSKLVAQG
jgi:aspartate aminotransferase